MQGQGGYGPRVASSPILTQTLEPRGDPPQGRHAGMMPPVGDTWTTAQIEALAAYVSKHVYKGASASGG